MRHQAPWQMMVYAIFMSYLTYALLACIAIAAAWKDYPYIMGGCLLLMMIIYVGAIPVNLNYTRASYKSLFIWLIGHMLLCIGAYAWVYSKAGLRLPDGGITNLYRDAFYFSATTWTTVGYGDLTAPPHLRLATSLEAITGLLFMPIATSLLWFMIQESTVPYQQAYIVRKQYKFSPNGDIIGEQTSPNSKESTTTT